MITRCTEQAEPEEHGTKPVRPREEQVGNDKINTRPVSPLNHASICLSATFHGNHTHTDSEGERRADKSTFGNRTFKNDIFMQGLVYVVWCDADTDLSAKKSLSTHSAFML